jgi:hypothetical protein
MWRVEAFPDENEPPNDVANAALALLAVNNSGVLDSGRSKPKQVVVVTEDDPAFSQTVRKLVFVAGPQETRFGRRRHKDVVSERPTRAMAARSATPALRIQRSSFTGKSNGTMGCRIEFDSGTAGKDVSRPAGWVHARICRARKGSKPRSVQNDRNGGSISLEFGPGVNPGAGSAWSGLSDGWYSYSAY